MTPARKKVVSIRQSPMNPHVWCLTLECGHDVWKPAKRRPTTKFASCPRDCSAPLLTDEQLHEMIKKSFEGRQNAAKRAIRVDAEAALDGDRFCREHLTVSVGGTNT